MKINKARTQLYSHATVYYVRSESNPKVKYMVLHTGKNYFCQCTDFIARRLPLFGTPGFTHCKHIQAVKEHAVPAAETIITHFGKESFKKSTKKFGLFYIASQTPFRSLDMPEEFKSKASALRHLRNKNSKNPNVFLTDYEARPIE